MNGKSDRTDVFFLIERGSIRGVGMSLVDCFGALSVLPASTKGARDPP